MESAFIASMPTHRWKQHPVSEPSSLPILLFFTRSSALRCIWVKRLIFFPVMCEVAVMTSSYSGFCASA